VTVKPGSTKGPLVETNEDGSLTVFLKQRAVDGAANNALIEVVAKHLGVRKSDVEIETGFTSRIKRLRIAV
jgi:uncharacterized protein YggU (UPF0235/DUF167 family)